MQPASKANKYHYNKILQPYANKLRKNMTKSEACLWKYVLRARMMRGFPFRRQRPILWYIADFVCLELRLVIELDGITHTWQEVQEKDRIKQQALEDVGFTVLRYWDEEVLNDIENVARDIEDWVVRLSSS